MWTSFCSGRLVCVITLAAAMLVSPAEGVGLSCCSKANRAKISVKACYEQKPRVGCKLHAFRIITESNKEWCISPSARWLKIKIKQGAVLCKPELS